jgi:D-alanine-D-alanine ligase
LLHDTVSAASRPDEADVLVQAEQVSAALAELGWQADALPVDIDLAAARAAIDARAPALVFNLVESLGGDGRLIHLVPALLDSLGVPFTGSHSDAIYLSSQKQLAKEWMRCHGIAAPRNLTAADTGSAAGEGLRTRWIVKSLWEHASLGLDDDSVVHGAAAAQARIEHCRERFGGEWFAEEYVEGRELNVSVIEHDGQPYVLPLAEMTFVDYPEDKPKIVGYAAKWQPDASEYGATQRVFAELPGGEDAAVRDTVQQCWRVFGLNGYARIDIRLAAGGMPYVLEVNANPCLSQDAGLAAAALQGGMDYRTLIQRIVHAALRPTLKTFRRTG